MEKKTFSISVDKEAVEALDEVIRKKGRFANRSQAIEYCIKQVLELEKHEKRYIEFLIDFLKIVEEHPEVGARLREFLREEKLGR
jgi:metal-responsive CopG/Arc/MetJ family transcriptional regulator